MGSEDVQASYLVKSTLVPDFSTSIERLQVQSIVIKCVLRFRGFGRFCDGLPGIYKT